MERKWLVQFLSGSAFAVLTFTLFAAWAEYSPDTLAYACVEDKAVETLTALLFGLASIAFLAAIPKCRLLKSRTEWWRYVFVLGWAGLMFLFMGEEVSWGQRILGFSTPAPIADASLQHEFNVHNLKYLQIRFLLPLLLLITGVVLPAIALTRAGKRVIWKLAFPVVPIGYSGFFVGSYLFGKLYSPLVSYSTELDAYITGASYEVGELLLAVGTFCFAVHGAIRPEDWFRVSRTGR